MPITIDRARAAKDKVLEHFKNIGKVVGVGITRLNDDYAVKVNLSEAPAQGTVLPTEIDGVPIKVDVVGQIRALS